MKGNIRFILFVCSSAALVFWGCASRPDQQMEEARIAMEEAAEVRAETFATADWDLAKEAWDEGQSLVAEGKFAGTANMFLRAKSRFEKARDIARSKRETLLKQIEEKRNIIGERKAELEERMEKARLSAAQKKDLEDCCAELKEAIAKLESEVEQGEYVLAHGTSEEAMKLLVEAESKLPRARR